MKRVRAGWIVALIYLLCVLAPTLSFAMPGSRAVTPCLTEAAHGPGVQAFTFFSLVETVLRDVTLYFVQREPASLGGLSWVIDAKEPAKITNAAVYGATIIAVDGNYDAANRLATEVGDEYGWAFVNVNMRPYYAEGSKTLAFEVAEQLGWRAPDRVFVPIASGSLYTKIWKGFNELVKVGLLDDVHTRMVGAQAEGCSPVAVAYAQGVSEVQPVKPRTIAKSLAIGAPADGYYALKVAR